MKMFWDCCWFPQMIKTRFRFRTWAAETSRIVSRVASSEDDLIPPYVFHQGDRVNAIVYIEMLKLWTASVRHKRLCAFQQDTAPSYTAHKTQYEMAPKLSWTCHPQLIASAPIPQVLTRCAIIYLSCLERF